MAARMVVVYKTPPDPAAFEKHYCETHIPLAKKLPGLRSYEVSRGKIAALAGAQDAYLIGTLHFDDMAALKSAFGSPVGEACAADRQVFAPDDALVQMFLFESAEA
jgi:uncharacterized protein (TIGR02118 family)